MAQLNFLEAYLGVEQANENWNRPLLNNLSRVIACATGDVCQCPCGLELQVRKVLARQELDKSRHNTRLDNLRDGWVALDRQELTEERRRFQLIS